MPWSHGRNLGFAANALNQLSQLKPSGKSLSPSLNQLASQLPQPNPQPTPAAHPLRPIPQAKP